ERHSPLRAFLLDVHDAFGGSVVAALGAYEKVAAGDLVQIEPGLLDAPLIRAGRRQHSDQPHTRDQPNCSLMGRSHRLSGTCRLLRRAAARVARASLVLESAVVAAQWGWSNSARLRRRRTG